MSITDWAIGLFILASLVVLAVLAIRPAVTVALAGLAFVQAGSIVREWLLQRPPRA